MLVAPFLQCHFHCEQLSVPDVTLLPSGGQRHEKKAQGWILSYSIYLCIYSQVGSVHLYDELVISIRQGECGCKIILLFSRLKAFFASRDQVILVLQEDKLWQKFANPTKHCKDLRFSGTSHFLMASTFAESISICAANRMKPKKETVSELNWH